MTDEKRIEEFARKIADDRGVHKSTIYWREELRAFASEVCREAVNAALDAFRPDAESWAEQITADVWDRPGIETREEFKAALVQVCGGLMLGARRDALKRAGKVVGELVAELTSIGMDFERGEPGNPRQHYLSIASGARDAHKAICALLDAEKGSDER